MLWTCTSGFATAREFACTWLPIWTHMVDSLLLTHVVDSFDCTYAVINLRGCSLSRFVTHGVTAWLVTRVVDLLLVDLRGVRGLCGSTVW